MLVDLVQVTARDGLRLHGALEVPPAGVAPSAHPPVDAWLCLHGTGSNFYAASTLAGLAPKLLAGGAAVLRATRAATTWCAPGRLPPGGRCKARRSSGSTKRRWIWRPGSSCSQARLPAHRNAGAQPGRDQGDLYAGPPEHPQVAALVAVSPPHLSYTLFAGVAGATSFWRHLPRPQALVQAGQGDELLFTSFRCRITSARPAMSIATGRTRNTTCCGCSIGWLVRRW